MAIKRGIRLLRDPFKKLSAKVESTERKNNLIETQFEEFFILEDLRYLFIAF